MHIDWPWRPVPELRDLSRAEQMRIWRRCSGRAILSWRFAFSIILSALFVGLVWFAGVLAMFAARLQGLDAIWISLIAFLILTPAMFVGTALTMQPWVNETRRRIRDERGEIHVS